MRLRIFRRWTWELACSPMEVRYGGTNPMHLVARDELQYLDENCSPSQWFPVEVVEGEKPKHPNDIKAQKECARISEEVKNILKNAKQGHFAVGLQRHGEPSKCICGGLILNGKCENETT